MKSIVKIFMVCIAMVGLSFCSKLDWWNAVVPETDKEPTGSGVTGFIFRPATVPATEENVKQLKVPTGFTVAKFAEKLASRVYWR